MLLFAVLVVLAAVMIALAATSGAEVVEAGREAAARELAIGDVAAPAIPESVSDSWGAVANGEPDEPLPPGAVIPFCEFQRRARANERN